MKEPHLEPISLKISTIPLKRPFKATTEEINCPLPMVRRHNPVTVADWCHFYAAKNELCRYAPDCHAYLDLLISRVNDGRPVDTKVLEKLGIDCEILKRAGR